MGGGLPKVTVKLPYHCATPGLKVEKKTKSRARASTHTFGTSKPAQHAAPFSPVHPPALQPLPNLTFPNASHF